MRDSVKARFEVLDERFRSCGGDGWMERLHTGCRWTEGPAYFPAGRYLLFSDIPNDQILRWDETTGAVGVFRHPAGYANGHTIDRQGRLVSCEQGDRRITRTEHDGSVTVLADSWDGKRLNSPNDIIERADGSLWFTDPSYGIDSDYEGHRADSEIGACHVYRLDPATGALQVIADDFERPNGLAFSADERQLYISDSRRKHIRWWPTSLSAAPSATTCSYVRPVRCTRSWSTSTAPATRGDLAPSDQPGRIARLEAVMALAATVLHAPSREFGYGLGLIFVIGQERA